MEILLQSIFQNPGFIHFAYISATNSLLNLTPFELVTGSIMGFSTISLGVSLIKLAIQRLKMQGIPRDPLSIKVIIFNGLLLFLLLGSCVGFFVSLIINPRPELKSLRDTSSFG